MGTPVFVDVSSISLVLPQSGKSALIWLRLLSKTRPLALGRVFGNIMRPKKRASRGRAPLILPIAHDVVVADCAKLAPSKSAALTRSVAPPLKNTNTSFGLCFCNLSLRTYMVAGKTVKLRYSLSSPVESTLRSCVHDIPRHAKRRRRGLSFARAELKRGAHPLGRSSSSNQTRSAGL